MGCSIGAYEISRLELPAGNWQLIGSVDSQTVSFLDTTLLCPLHYAYRINAINLCGEGYNAFSDTSVAKPENELADQEVQIVRSTVINNKSVLTEWLPPVLAPDRVMIYNIYRSTDSINYSFLAAVPVLSQSYIDNSVQVENQNYFYRILAINDCNVEGTNFTNSSSILIQGKWVNEKTTLTWTKYRQWDSGVNQYVIERLDANGQWKVIKVVDGTINSAILDE